MAALEKCELPRQPPSREERLARGRRVFEAWCAMNYAPKTELRPVARDQRGLLHALTRGPEHIRIRLAVTLIVEEAARALNATKQLAPADRVSKRSRDSDEANSAATAALAGSG